MTYSKVEAHTKIIKLVEDFHAHEATLEKAAEAQIENNFIRPLFRYLNWNTENEGLSHAHYEFKVQVTNRKGLRPDYILNLDGRDVLVMDAKQVKYSMKDPRWLYQVYSYAYSTQNSKPSEKIDFAILTDFQEFIVLDCTLFAAKPEAVNNFRVIDWKYTDYVDKFDELWELFERNHVMEDSRRGDLHGRPEGKDGGKPRPNNGLWSRYLSPQKVKANRIPPDKAFLAQMDDEKDGWRVLLAKDMKKLNPSADGDLITAAVQLLIDRLIFIKALSDREVDRDYLSEIKARVTEAGLGAAQRDAGWFASCKTIFEELNNFYNGSIFAPRPELENVSVSNKVVQAVITDLQPENSPYNFAVLPVEILGTIYERFLGRVVRTTEKQVKIEEKPEVRKAGGVYYTPQYIVDYIVENTLGELLEEKRPEGFEHDSVESRKPSGRSMTPADVAKIKVLDPSCGSGSFLLGAYGKLIEWHKDYFARAGREKRDRESFYRDESGQIRLTAKLKRDILKNNLFGVDIDPQAVEVTRFSLSLKALEDLREGELTEERTLFHQTVLPDLSQNIKNGNALIGTDYFGLITPTIEELKAVKPFNWKTEFSEIMNSGGFDCIIGNPPYVRQESLSEYKNYFQKTYQSYNGVADLYVYFIEKGIKLIREGGFYSIIVSSSFLRATYGESLRTFLKGNSSIIRITDFGGLAIFQDAKDTYVCIPLLSKNLPVEQIEIRKINSLPDTNLESIAKESSYVVPVSQFTTDAWALDRSEKLNLFKKIMKLGTPLGDYVGNNFFRGVTTGLNEAFVIDTETKERLILKDPKSAEIIKPFLQGEDVRNWFITPKDKWLIFTRRGTDIEKYPAIEEHLLQWKEDLTPKQGKDQKRGRKPGRYKWFEIQDDVAYYQIFDNPKIVFPDIAKFPRFYLDKNGYYLANTGYAIGINDLYLLGILNSNLFWFSISNISIPFGIRAGEYRYRLISQYMEKVPIRAIDFSNPAEKSQHEKMVSLVSQMLELHKSKAGAKTQAEMDVYERQIKSVDEAIDGLVYELYGLTEEEIKIVENQT